MFYLFILPSYISKSYADIWVAMLIKTRKFTYDVCVLPTAHLKGAQVYNHHLLKSQWNCVAAIINSHGTNTSGLQFIDTHKFIRKLNVIVQRYYLRVNNMPVISPGFILFSSSHNVECIMSAFCLFGIYAKSNVFFTLRYLRQKHTEANSSHFKTAHFLAIVVTTASLELICISACVQNTAHKCEFHTRTINNLYLPI